MARNRMGIDSRKVILTASTIERFWSYVNKTDGCWFWTSDTSAKGYGRLRVGGRSGRPIGAHRISYFLAHGEWPLPFCLHSCDVRSCVNPSHLRAGTHAENMKDVALRDRRKGLHRGENHPNAKLTNDQVLAIRQCEGKSRREIAQLFNIPARTVDSIISGKSWQHIK